MSNPYLIKEPTCISFSGGRTSAFMLKKILDANNGLPADCYVCFANTGKEDEATLKFVKDIEDNWNVKITWLEFNNESEHGFDLVNFETASRDGEPFQRLIRYKGILPNVFMRFCTQELKVKIIRNYLKSINADVDDRSHYVGIRSDEPRRLAKVGIDMCPLARDGITEHHIGEFWSKNNFDLKLPKVGMNTLSNCDLCFLKGDKILAAIIQDKPSRATWWIKMEEEQQKKLDFKKDNMIATFRKGSVSYQQMMTFSKNQTDMFSSESISCFCGD